MKVLHVRRMMWYVHERRPAIFDGQPPSRSCRDAYTPDHGLPEGQYIISCLFFAKALFLLRKKKNPHRTFTARASSNRTCDALAVVR